jgi:hypothetical protein
VVVQPDGRGGWDQPLERTIKDPATIRRIVATANSLTRVAVSTWAFCLDCVDLSAVMLTAKNGRTVVLHDNDFCRGSVYVGNGRAKVSIVDTGHRLWKLLLRIVRGGSGGDPSLNDRANSLYN